MKVFSEVICVSWFFSSINHYGPISVTISTMTFFHFQWEKHNGFSDFASVNMFRSSKTAYYQYQNIFTEPENHLIGLTCVNIT